MHDQVEGKTSIILIGHLAIDRTIRFKKRFKPSLGGSVSYGSLALTKYDPNLKIGIISHVGKLNFSPKLLNKLKHKQIDLSGIKWSNTSNTKFVLDYWNHNRILTLESKSPNLRFEDTPHSYLKNPPHAIMLVPICNEISYEYVVNVLDEFPNIIIGIDVQGFLRKIDNQGKISYIQDDKIISNMKKIIHLIGDRLVLKGSEIEMKLISGCEKYEDIMECFRDYNTNSIFIMTLGESGSYLVKNGEKLLKIPAFKPKRVKDETGAGDVYLAVFLREYIFSNKAWNEVEQCAYKASAAASFLVEEKGTHGIETKEKVLKRVQKKNYIV